MPELTPQAFADRWGKSRLSERASAQPHFIDLCHMLGEKTPAEADPNGDFYTFERRVDKVGSGQGKGFADVWYKGHFAFEYKGKHKDLEAAYDQLLRYREDLGNPPLLVVCDVERFQIHTNFTDSTKRVYSFTNAELPRPENLRLLRALFRDPQSLAPDETSEGVTQEAARGFAKLADGLRSRGVEPERASHFLNKLLFCLFAEDVGLLPKELFTRILSRTGNDPERFARYAGDLFTAMSEGGDFLLEDIRHFNGGLFADGDTLPLEKEELKTLASIAKLDWGSVEPAIFGTLFERSLDPSQRAKLGAHYTSKEDILTLVEPVLMAPLRREWEQVRQKAASDAQTATEQSGRKAANSLARAERELQDFAGKLRQVKVLDPACGSGNFLYVSLKELLDLEKEVATFAVQIGMTSFFPEISPEQLYGMEVSPYAHELAQVSIWIGYLQWMVDNGFGSLPDPVLGPMTNIKRMDAILGHDEDGKPVEPEWPEADVIVGNPPFLGDKKMRAELSGEYVEQIRKLYSSRVPGGADLVTYWFERARKYIEDGSLCRAGLLATNGIRFGANRKILQRIKKTGDIFFAEADRSWIPENPKEGVPREQASVRVSMIGFDDGSEVRKVLGGVPVQAINSDLTGSLDVTVAKKLDENSNICFLGMMKSGPFDLDNEIAAKMLEAPLNPNGRPNSDVIKRRVGGQDIVRRPRDIWIIDFGVDTPLDEAALYETPFEYVRQHVKPLRDTNRRASTRERWWIFGEARRNLRKAIQERRLTRCAVTPEVSKHRLFAWIDTRVVPDHKLHVFAREDDYFFGVLQSRAHETWSLAQGNWLGKGNDPSYSSTTTFETFSFPWPPGEEPVEDERVQEISEAAKRLDDLRRHWLDPEGMGAAELKKRTLTNLYNARPMWLDNAHKRLDRAVYAAYGWPKDPSDEDILKNLLALNAARSALPAGASR